MKDQSDTELVKICSSVLNEFLILLFLVTETISNEQMSIGGWGQGDGKKLSKGGMINWKDFNHLRAFTK